MTTSELTDIDENVNDHFKKKHEPLTAPTQKAGFRVPKTFFWLIKYRFFKPGFVEKVPPFG
jgi:hypothetical protein